MSSAGSQGGHKCSVDWFQILDSALHFWGALGFAERTQAWHLLCSRSVCEVETQCCISPLVRRMIKPLSPMLQRG
jgi:hypothetical protein